MTATTLTSPASTHIPGPAYLPVIGSTLRTIRLATQPLAWLQDHYQRYGAVSGMQTFRNGQQGTLLALGAEFNKAVLTNPDLFHSPDPSILGDDALIRLTSGLVTMNGERHRQHRRLMMPAFHRQAVAGYQSLMERYTAQMLERWQGKQQINLIPELRQLILRIVSHTLFGLDDPENNEALGNLIYRWTRMSNSIAHLLLPPLRRRLTRLSGQLEQALLKIIQQKRTGEMGDDVLSTLIQTHDEDGISLTDTELLGHLAILFIAGHETTVNALAWTLILLARYPDLRLALVDSLAGDVNHPLLDQIIKESMRLLPPVVYTVRQGVESFELGGYTMAKDSTVILSHFITHRLPEIYTQPDRFLPQRWEHLDVSPYEYLPFSASSRMCIGATFASVEMRIILSMLLPRFQVIPVEKTDYQVAGNILHPRGDVPCTLAPAGEKRTAIDFSGNLIKLIH